MIDAKELRKGNMVMFMGREIFVHGGTIQDLERDNAVQSQYEPIPLTPEILKKCGFEMPAKILMLSPNDDYWFLFDDAYGFGIQVEKQGESEYICERFKIECKYLHQLQNLYYSLTSKELEIKF